MYNDKIPTETSDRNMFTMPVAIARLLSATAFHGKARSQPERWASLEAAGFKVDAYGDIQSAISESVLLFSVLTKPRLISVDVRLGGHYIDVGTSAKISKGLVCPTLSMGSLSGAVSDPIADQDEV
jgi:hypothetical protein